MGRKKDTQTSRFEAPEVHHNYTNFFRDDQRRSSPDSGDVQRPGMKGLSQPSTLDVHQRSCCGVLIHLELQRGG